MSLAPNLRVPELIAGVDVRTLPLSALEGFVLSRIDGRSTSADIVSLTGLPSEQVLAILDKLQGLGAIRYRTESEGFDAPTGAAQRGAEARAAAREQSSEAPGSGLHSAPSGRRRVSHGPGAQPRRMLSESAISSPPPELPPQSSRPRGFSEWGGPGTSRTHSLPPAQGGRGAATPPPSSPPTSRRPLASQAAPGQPRQPSVPSPTQARAAPGEQASKPPPAASAAPLSGFGQPATTTFGPAPMAGRQQGTSLVPSGMPAPAVYDPRELDEDVDLPRERRKQVLDLYHRLAELDYYEALGVAYRAEKKEIRSAYFALSKLLHPDSMFRKNLGSFKSKMEAVFNYLTEAYETLSKKKSRDEYDTYLRATKAARMAERALSFEPNPEAEVVPPLIDVHVPPLPPLPEVAEPRGAPQSSEPPPLPPREISAEARKLAQEVIGRRLRGAAPVGSARMAPSPEAPAPGEAAAPAGAAPKGPFEAPSKTDTQGLLKRLTRTLRDVGQLTGSNDRITRAMRASQTAAARGDLSEATQQAARAASLAPERQELKAEHTRLSVMLSEKLANDYIEQAKFEMKHGKWASAALSWAKVCEGRPNDAGAHRQAAQALLKAGGELRGAQKYAQKAIFLAPTDIEARILLSQIYLTVGLKLNARRELDAAAKLDPANDVVKNLLVDLEKG